MIHRNELKFIPTNDDDGNPNGAVIPIWHVDTGPKVDQVYLTTVHPGAQKGPHLHLKREGRFTCIKGDVAIVTRKDGVYERNDIGEQSGFAMLVIPVGVAAAVYNLGSEDAYLLNMPSPPWRADEPDEHEVTNWEYRL